MQKKDFRKLALLGLSSGILISNTAIAQETSTTTKKPATAETKATKSADKSSSSTTTQEDDPNDGNMNYHLMSEDELILELDAKGLAMYRALDPEGKLLARKVASAMCNGTNECKGLNACQTDKNACAGKGSCKGTGKCALADKNLAVKLVSDKMAQKRAQAGNPSN